MYYDAVCGSVALWPRTLAFSFLLLGSMSFQQLQKSSLSPKDSQTNLGKEAPTFLARLGCQQLMKGQEWEGDGMHIKWADLMLEKLELLWRGWAAERQLELLNSWRELWRVAPGFQRLVRPLGTRGVMKASVWQAGLPAGRAGRQQRASEAGQPHISCAPLWSRSVWEDGAKGVGGGEGFHRRPQRKKSAEAPSPWISNCLSREVYLHVLLGFREEKNQGRGWTGAWRDGAEGPAATPLGQRTDVQATRDVGCR